MGFTSLVGTTPTTPLPLCMTLKPGTSSALLTGQDEARAGSKLARNLWRGGEQYAQRDIYRCYRKGKDEDNQGSHGQRCRLPRTSSVKKSRDRNCLLWKPHGENISC